MNEYNFKQLIEQALYDDNPEDRQVYDIKEIMYCVELDDILIHEDEWKGTKPEQDIELFGEHWYKKWWLE